MKKLRVFVKEPGKAPELREVDHSLASLQQIVGGYIETVTMCRDFIIVCNEEGLLLDLDYNCRLCGCDFFGTIFFVSSLRGDFVDICLNEQDLRKFFPALYAVE